MTIEVAVALVLLLVGSSLQNEQYDNKERETAFVRMMTKAENINKTLNEHMKGAEELQSDLNELRIEFDDSKKKLASLEETVDSNINYCPVPEGPLNSHFDVVLRHPGAELGFTCNNGYSKCSEKSTTITCKNDKTWTSSDTKCGKLVVSRNNPPEYVEFGKELVSGTLVIVKGKATATHTITFNIINPNGYILLHSNFRYNYLVVNRHVWWWDYEYRPTITPWPFVTGQEFTFLIRVTDSRFEVYCDDRFLYNYDTLGRKSTKLQLTGNAVFYSATVIEC